MTGISQLDALRDGPDYRAGTFDFRAPSGDGVVLYRTALPAGLYVRRAADDLVLQLQLTAGTRTRIDHGVRFDCTTRPGHLVLAPRGVDLRYDMAGPASFIGAVLPAGLLRGVLPETDRARATDLGWLHAVSFADETVEALLRRLWGETAGRTPIARLLADSAWTALALLLHARSRDRDGFGRPPATRGATRREGSIDWRMRRTLDHIEGHLGTDVGLDELAREVGLSRRQYSAMFRRATGHSPYAWLTIRRVEHAAHLLRTTHRSVTDVAHECGFSSPQHLATVFRRHRGTSPAAYRREGR